jgi:hypothetical protein
MRCRTPTITFSPTPGTGGTASGAYWCQANSEIFKSVTYQKTLDPTGTVEVRLAACVPAPPSCTVICHRVYATA